jgi:hypothetical protein
MSKVPYWAKGLQNVSVSFPCFVNAISPLSWLLKWCSLMSLLLLLLLFIIIIGSPGI